jgi:hypothetical protein
MTVYYCEGNKKYKKLNNDEMIKENGKYMYDNNYTDVTEEMIGYTPFDFESTYQFYNLEE